MNLYNELETIVVESGLWQGTRRSTHSFVLSPDVYTITPEQKTNLTQLGEALHDVLKGMGRIMTIASNPHLGAGRQWQMIASALNTGVPECYKNVQTLQPHRTPAICKVDLMVERETGKYYIAEIDGHNKHGLGYSAIAAALRNHLRPEAQSFPGVCALLAKLIRNRNEGGNQATLLYADQERFYLPEFEALKLLLATDHGIELEVVDEMHFPITAIQPGLGGKNGVELLPKLFIDLPFLYRRPELNTALLAAYQNETIDFLIPPKPFMGSKAILALLRNDERDPVLEAILRAHINHGALELLRQHIPVTYLLTKHKTLEYWKQLSAAGGPKVLKGSISSGMKRIVMPEEPHAAKALEHACASYYHCIMQEKICNQPFAFQFYQNNGDLDSADWYLRVTVHYCLREIADVIVTARTDDKVHGAKDCLQLGAILLPNGEGH